MTPAQPDQVLVGVILVRSIPPLPTGQPPAKCDAVASITKGETMMNETQTENCRSAFRQREARQRTTPAAANPSRRERHWPWAGSRTGSPAKRLRQDKASHASIGDFQSESEQTGLMAACMTSQAVRSIHEIEQIHEPDDPTTPASTTRAETSGAGNAYRVDRKPEVSPRRQAAGSPVASQRSAAHDHRSPSDTMAAPPTTGASVRRPARTPIAQSPPEKYRSPGRRPGRRRRMTASGAGLVDQPGEYHRISGVRTSSAQAVDAGHCRPDLIRVRRYGRVVSHSRQLGHCQCHVCPLKPHCRHRKRG